MEKKAKVKKIQVSQKEYEELKQKAAERDEYNEKWIKVHAEYENTRRRLEKEKTDHLRFANEGIISDLFPIVDNFDMALAAMDEAKDKAAVMAGIQLVQKEFHRILDENGVKQIKTKGEQFDPQVHEAVSMVQTDECAEGEIVEEVRSGYLLNDRLLRPAQVIVAKGSEEKDKKEGGENG